MDNLEKKIDALSDRVDNLAAQVAKGFELAEKKFDSIDKRFDKIEDSIEALKGGSAHTMGTIEKEIKEGFSEVITELKKINAVTRYEDIHANTPRIGEA